MDEHAKDAQASAWPAEAAEEVASAADRHAELTSSEVTWMMARDSLRRSMLMHGGLIIACLAITIYGMFFGSSGYIIFWGVLLYGGWRFIRAFSAYGTVENRLEAVQAERADLDRQAGLAPHDLETVASRYPAQEPTEDLR